MQDYRYELYHHGTKGMKWGRRRYQHPDGSLTALGRIRYGVGKAGSRIKGAAKNASEKRKARKAIEAENKRRSELLRKPVSKLSEAELAERVSRRAKEKQLLDVEKQIENLSGDGRSVLSRYMGKAVNDVAVPALVSAGKDALTKYLSKSFGKALGLINDDSDMDALKKTVDKLELQVRDKKAKEALSDDGKDSELETLKKSVEKAELQVRDKKAQETLSGTGKDDQSAILAKTATGLENINKIVNNSKHLETDLSTVFGDPKMTTGRDYINRILDQYN